METEAVLMNPESVSFPLPVKLQTIKKNNSLKYVCLQQNLLLAPL